MCRYAEAAQACDTAARRAEYTARQSPKIAGRIDDPKSQTHREAETLVDEWVAVREGLSAAAETLTLISQNREAFDAFCQSLQAPKLPPARAPIAIRAAPASPRAVEILKAALTASRNGGAA